MDSLKELNRLTDRLSEKYDTGVIMNLMKGSSIPSVERVPIESPKLGEIFGCGGVPRGRMIEIFGPESSGKTSICEYIAGQFQKHDFECLDKKTGELYTRKGVVVYVDMENSFDPEHATTQGFDIDKCILSQPDSGEDAVDIVCAYVESGLVDLVILDSISACTPRVILDGSSDQQTIGALARLMSKFVNKVVPLMKNSRCTVICVNQIRATMNMYGPGEDTTGGYALKFAYSVRISARKKDWIMGSDGTTIEGITIRVKGVKNKTARPGVVDVITMMFDRGISSTDEWIEFAIKYGVIRKQAAGFFTLADGTKIRGLENLKKFMLAPENESRYDEIVKLTRSIMANSRRDTRVSTTEESGDAPTVEVDDEGEDDHVEDPVPVSE